MKSRNVFIALGVVAALAASAYGYTAFAQGGPGYGPGMMGGGGPGWMMRGGGPGGGPWNCPAFGENGGPGGDRQGYGPGYRMRSWGGGYGPGYHMRGWGRGYGPGYDRRDDAQSNQTPQNNQSAQSNPDNQTLNLSVDDVKARMERWLTWRGNSRLKLGEVKETDANTITADVVTKDNSLVQRFIIDRHTGVFRRDNG